MNISKLPSSPPTSIRSTRCRLCLSESLELLFSLKPTPPAEWYFPESHRSATSRTFPLDLVICHNCYHVQLVDVLDPQALFSNYFYESQTSPGLISHFAKYAQSVSREVDLMPGALVVDIGSNDGTLLENFQRLGFRVAGVEPSIGLSNYSNSRGIKTYNSFLNMETVRAISANLGMVDLITANNVFAHNDDLRGMAECINALLKPGGKFVFEVSSILHTIKGSVFDYIYHEHLSYHSLISLIPFLKEFELNIFHVEIIHTKGGSYRVYAEKGRPKRGLTRDLDEALRLEYREGLENTFFYTSMMNRVRTQKEKLLSFLKDTNKNSSLVGFGASATTTTLAYEFELVDKIKYLVDDNPIRHNCLLPGTDIKVYSPEHMENEPNSAVILLAWRFSDLILPKLKGQNNTSKVIIKPLPEFSLI